MAVASDSQNLNGYTARAVANARLTVPQNEAIRVIKAQLEKGLELKRAKIRYVPELEKAREAKGEWTVATMELLRRLFNTDAVADECQNWVGKVLPEYADLNLFIEHFYDEMDQRLRKLHAVLKQVQGQGGGGGGGMGDDGGPKSLIPNSAVVAAAHGVTIGAAPVAAPTSSSDLDDYDSTIIHTPAPAPKPAVISPGPTRGNQSAQEAYASARGMGTYSSTSLLSTPSSLSGLSASGPSVAAPAPAPAPAPTPAPASHATHGGHAAHAAPGASGKRVAAIIIYDNDPQAQETIQGFISRLGFEVHVIVEAPGAKGKGAMIEKLDHIQRLDFMLILSKPDVPCKPFDLGYCVGKLGLKRTFVLSADGDKVFVDEHGLLHIPLDPADGWQLHLARQFKRTGIDVDLNRVF